MSHHWVHWCPAPLAPATLNIGFCLGCKNPPEMGCMKEKKHGTHNEQNYINNQTKPKWKFVWIVQHLVWKKKCHIATNSIRFPPIFKDPRLHPFRRKFKGYREDCWVHWPHESEQHGLMPCLTTQLCTTWKWEFLFVRLSLAVLPKKKLRRFGTKTSKYV